MEVLFAETLGVDFASVDPYEHVRVSADEYADADVDEVGGVESSGVLE